MELSAQILSHVDSEIVAGSVATDSAQVVSHTSRRDSTALIVLLRLLPQSSFLYIHSLEKHEQIQHLHRLKPQIDSVSQ